MLQDKSTLFESGETRKIRHGNVAFVREVSARYSGPRRKPVQIHNAGDVKAFLVPVLKDDAREHFFALYLDGANQVVSYTTVSVGTADQTYAHPREVFQAAILAGAIRVIVAHNHPTGNTEPSAADRAVTKQIREAGLLLGIPLLDHVIFTHESYVSFADRGELA